MRIASQLLNLELNLSDETATVLSIENTLLYRKVICAFENDSVDDLLVFSEAFKPFDFTKKGVFISNPVCIGFDSKKLQTRMLAKLSELANEEDWMCLKEQMFSFADRLTQINGFELMYNPEFGISDFIKLLDFKVRVSDLTAAERLVKFVLLLSEYMGSSLFVMANIHLYFAPEEIKSILDDLLLHHITVLVIEPFQPKNNLASEKHFVLDKDLCLIDNAENIV